MQPRVPRQNAMPTGDSHLHGISTLNVCSLRNCALEAKRFLSTEQPLLCVFTETKLLTWEHKHDFVANLHHDYASFISSRHPQDINSTVNLHTGTTQTQGQAGVLIAVKKNFAQGHLIKRMAIPRTLEGYMVHLRLSLPGSVPLHILGV